jgi:hypothetical protein
MRHIAWDKFDYRVDVCRVTHGTYIAGFWFKAWETRRVAAADSAGYVRVRWEINFLLTLECAQFFWYTLYSHIQQ